MKYFYIIILLYFYTNIFSQSFEVISEAAEGKKMIFSVHVKDFKFTSLSYDKIAFHGDSLYYANPDNNVMALYFVKPEFTFKTYQESIDLFNDYLLNKYDYYNSICVAMYKKGKLTLRPFKYFNEQRFN